MLFEQPKFCNVFDNGIKIYHFF